MPNPRKVLLNFCYFVYFQSQEPPEETVRKLLERELRLFDLIDPRDLRSYAWYHGCTLPGGRKGAEAEIPHDGDFLVRDCSSQPGNYVLSVRHKGQALHFVINKVSQCITHHI